jgi:hypothetical protein
VKQKKTSQKPSRFQWVSWVLMVGLGLLGLWQFHCTEFNSHFDQVPGGRGDNRFVTAILEYLYEAHQGFGQYLSPFFYFPAQRTLGYSDAYLTHAFFYGWLRNLGFDLFSCYQICVLAFNLLNYVSCFLMLRKGFGFGIAASSIGAFLFAFNAPKFNQISHTQLQCLFWLPLAVWAVVSWIRERHKMDQGSAFWLLAGAGLAIDLQLLTAFYHGWFFLFWTALFLFLALGSKAIRGFGKDLFLRFWPALAGALAVFAAGLLPFLWLYLPVIRDLGGKSYEEVQTMIPTFWCHLWMGPEHGVWGWLKNLSAIQALPIEGEERMGFGMVLFLGWMFLTLVALKILKGGDQRGIFPVTLFKALEGNGVYLRLAALAVLATTLFCLLGLQYGPGFSPWHWVYQIVPGAQSIRAVSRYAITLALPLSIIVAFVLHLLIEKGLGEKRKRSGVLVLGFTFLTAGVMVAEQMSLPPCPGFSKNAELSRLEYLSQKLPGQCWVFYVAPSPGLPLELDYSSTNLQIDAMLISAVREVPTFNGYSGHSPKNWGLFKLRSPKYEQYVKEWQVQSGLDWKAFRLEIDR